MLIYVPPRSNVKNFLFCLNNVCVCDVSMEGCYICTYVCACVLLLYIFLPTNEIVSPYNII